jgi:hypothetical protein
MDWIKAITELLKALAHFAWPVLVGLIVWWFRKEIRSEIASLIARISKLKGPGVEIEIREQIKLGLENVRAGLPAESVQEVGKMIQQAIAAAEAAETLRTKVEGTATSSASVKPTLVEGLDYLVDLTSKDPRDAIKRSWVLLARNVLKIVGVLGENFEPNSYDISEALRRLERIPSHADEALIRSIKNLQDIARKVFYQSQFAYDPSPKEAEEFVLYSIAARKDLGEKID